MGTRTIAFTMGTVILLCATLVLGCGEKSTSSPPNDTTQGRKPPLGEHEVDGLTMQGGKLSPDAAAELETQLAADPNLMNIRAQLIGYYSSRQFDSDSDREMLERHALWVIEHAPASALAGSHDIHLDPIINPGTYTKAKRLWLSHAEQRPKDTVILGSAADFFLIHDRGQAEALLNKCIEIEPDNSHWKERLGHLHSLEMMFGSAYEDAAKEALAAFESAAKGASGVQRVLLLGNLAKTAFEVGQIEDARKYAEELLEMAPKGNWNYGNAIYEGNHILGRIALQEGDKEKAKEHLLAAGKTTGSPQLDSFGPEFTLAQELLDADESEAVLEFLELCGKFWDEKEKLSAWANAIKEGETPRLNRFDFF